MQHAAEYELDPAEVPIYSEKLKRLTPKNNSGAGGETNGRRLSGKRSPSPTPPPPPPSPYSQYGDEELDNQSLLPKENGQSLSHLLSPSSSCPSPSPTAVLSSSFYASQPSPSREHQAQRSSSSILLRPRVPRQVSRVESPEVGQLRERRERPAEREETTQAVGDTVRGAAGGRERAYNPSSCYHWQLGCRWTGEKNLLGQHLEHCLYQDLAPVLYGLMEQLEMQRMKIEKQEEKLLEYEGRIKELESNQTVFDDAIFELATQCRELAEGPEADEEEGCESRKDKDKDRRREELAELATEEALFLNRKLIELQRTAEAFEARCMSCEVDGRRSADEGLTGKEIIGPSVPVHLPSVFVLTIHKHMFFTSGLHNWDFIVEEGRPERKERDIVVGCRSPSVALRPSYISRFAGWEDNGIGYWERGGIVRNGLLIARAPPYGPGDVISVALDMNDKVLAFSLNGEPVGPQPLKHIPSKLFAANSALEGDIRVSVSKTRTLRKGWEE